MLRSTTANYDEPWKAALDDYFDAFLAFFFPEICQQVDWSLPPQPLDKELQQITAGAETEKCVADKLYQVWLLDSQEIWILIHVEVQSQYDASFPQRLYIYNYRAFDLYHRPVVSLAILGDERETWRPSHYQTEFMNCRLRLDYPIVKLLDYAPSWSELEASANPFAVLVMAHLKTKTTTGKPEERAEWKWAFIRGLYDRGLTREEIIRLFQLIDRMMTLPNALQERLEQKLQQFEEKRTMPLLSNMELRGLEKGKEIGKEMGEEIGKKIGAQEKAQSAVRTLLQARFGSVPGIETLAQITNLGQLEDLLRLAATVENLEDFQQALTARPYSEPK